MRGVINTGVLLWWQIPPPLNNIPFSFKLDQKDKLLTGSNNT